MSKSQNFAKENGFKKFNSSLIHDEIYLSKTKEFVQQFKTFLKHEMRKFTINYLKNVAKKKTTKRRIYLTNMKFGSSVISKILQKMRKLKRA